MSANRVPSELPLLRIRILGPVDVIGAAGPVLVGGRLEKMLLGALAISANHDVSVDALAQVLWDDTPPASRDNTIQTYISRLRAAIGYPRITSEDHRYKLHVAPHELDALAFDAMITRANAERSDAAHCLDLCNEALRLWRGTPFGDFADLDPYRLEVIRLEDLRLFAVELKLECEIGLGREELVAGSLSALVEEYPYRERIWHLLIVALALSGRRVEALRACADLRSVLGAVGLEPTSQILLIEEQILAEDPAIRPRFGLREFPEPVAHTGDAAP